MCITLSGIIVSGCTDSNSADKNVNNSTDSSEKSETISNSGAESSIKVYDSSPISQAYLSGNTNDLDEYQLEIYDKASSVISEIIKPDMTDYEKELAVHDYIVLHTNYDEVYINALGIMSPNADNPYGGLINGRTICSGYSTTFQLFMDMLEIPCKTIYAEDFMGDEHSWNMVKICGSWYYVDVCWDDSTPDFDNRPVRHKYFNVSEEYMKEKHVWDSSEMPETGSCEYSYISQTLTDLTDISELFPLMENAIEDMNDSVAVRLNNDDSKIMNKADRIDDYLNTRKIKGLSDVFDEFSASHSEYDLSCQRVKNGDDIVLVIYMRKNK